MGDIDEQAGIPGYAWEIMVVPTARDKGVGGKDVHFYDLIPRSSSAVLYCTIVQCTSLQLLPRVSYCKIPITRVAAEDDNWSEPSKCFDKIKKDCCGLSEGAIPVSPLPLPQSCQNEETDGDTVEQPFAE